jgi:hypothetical protein
MFKKNQEKHHKNVKKSKREIPRKCPKEVKRSITKIFREVRGSIAKMSKRNQEKHRENIQEKSREALQR